MVPTRGPIVNLQTVLSAGSDERSDGSAGLAASAANTRPVPTAFRATTDNTISETVKPMPHAIHIASLFMTQPPPPGSMRRPDIFIEQHSPPIIQRNQNNLE